MKLTTVYLWDIILFMYVLSFWWLLSYKFEPTLKKNKNKKQTNECLHKKIYLSHVIQCAYRYNDKNKCQKWHKHESNIIISTNWKSAKAKHTTFIAYLWIHKPRLHTVLDIYWVLLANTRTHSEHVLVPQHDIQYPLSDHCQDFQNEHDRSPLQWNHVTSYRQMYGSQSQTLLIASRLMHRINRINWKFLIPHLIENVDKWQDDVEIT